MPHSLTLDGTRWPRLASFPSGGGMAALTDPATIDLVHHMIQTGREYRKTHEKYSHGIRSTPP